MAARFSPFISYHFMWTILTHEGLNKETTYFRKVREWVCFLVFPRSRSLGFHSFFVFCSLLLVPTYERPSFFPAESKKFIQT